MFRGSVWKVEFELGGFRKAALTWEDVHAQEFVERGFLRGVVCSVVLDHPKKYLSCAVYGVILPVVGWRRIWIGLKDRREVDLKSK